jgi:hypothetical protein
LEVSAVVVGASITRKGKERQSQENNQGSQTEEGRYKKIKNKKKLAGW